MSQLASQKKASKKSKHKANPELDSWVDRIIELQRGLAVIKPLLVELEGLKNATKAELKLRGLEFYKTKKSGATCTTNTHDRWTGDKEIAKKLLHEEVFKAIFSSTEVTQLTVR